MTVAAGDAELAALEAAAILGGGLREADAPGGAVALDFWVTPGSADPRGLRDALAARGIAASVALADEDPSWMDAMRRFHRPVAIAGRLLVRPPWEPPRAGLLDVEIDPGMAFGTAQHATTRSCLELLCGLPPGGPLLDAGCGSGVLAIAARRLGFDPVWALDMDPLAVQATIANARVNGVGLRVARRAIGADRLPAAPVVVANLTGTVLALLAGALAPPAPRRLIASGMRPGEVPAVAAAFAPLGLRELACVTAEGWSTVLLGRS